MQVMRFAGVALAAAVSVGEAAEAGGTAIPQAHPRLTIVRLQDATDRHNELVFETEYLLAANELPFDVTAPAVFWEDSLSGEGTAYFRQAPLPHARTAKTPDFHIDPTGGVTVLESPYPCVTVGYSGGAVGRVRAMTDFQRGLRPYVSGRDGVFLSNTWGDGNRDSRINEKFLLREIDAGAELGVDVIQIDDGWQAGRSANSAAIAKRADGRWGRFWDDPHFWDVDPVRFPNGLKPLIESARAKGMRFGLWFGPDSSNDAACWEKDATFLLSLHRTLGISYFKLDSMRTETPLALERQTKLMRRLIADSGAKITVDLDVTDGVRPGYYGFPEIGPVFVENRYIAKGDCRLWWPHLTLRNFWSLARYVDPARLRMEVLNPERMPELYAPDDPLAPVKWPRDAIFAISMFASPLGWFEIQNLSPGTVAFWKPLIETWKRHRDAIHEGYIHPVGSRPDGVSWTGFVASARDGRSGYVLLFRELSDRSDFTLDLSGMIDSKELSASVIGGRGRAELTGESLKVSVADRLDYIWLKLDSGSMGNPAKGS